MPFKAKVVSRHHVPGKARRGRTGPRAGVYLDTGPEPRCRARRLPPQPSIAKIGRRLARELLAAHVEDQPRHRDAAHVDRLHDFLGHTMREQIVSLFLRPGARAIECRIIPPPALDRRPARHSRRSADRRQRHAVAQQLQDPVSQFRRRDRQATRCTRRQRRAAIVADRRGARPERRQLRLFQRHDDAAFLENRPSRARA